MNRLMTLALAGLCACAMAQTDPDKGLGQNDAGGQLVTNQRVYVPALGCVYDSGNKNLEVPHFSFDEALATGKYRNGNYTKLDGDIARQKKYLARVERGELKKVIASLPFLVPMWHGGNNYEVTVCPGGAGVFVDPNPGRVLRYQDEIPGDPTRFMITQYEWYRYVAHEFCGNWDEGTAWVVVITKIPGKLIEGKVKMEREKTEQYVEASAKASATATVNVAAAPAPLIYTPVGSRGQVLTQGFTRSSIQTGGAWYKYGTYNCLSPYCVGTPPTNVPGLPPLNPVGSYANPPGNNSPRQDPSIPGGRGNNYLTFYVNPSSGKFQLAA